MKIKVSVSVLLIYDLVFTITYGSSRSQIFQIGIGNIKQISLKILQNLQEITCTGIVFYDKVADLQPTT